MKFICRIPPFWYHLVLVGIAMLLHGVVMFLDQCCLSVISVFQCSDHFVTKEMIHLKLKGQ